jgi:hypothetical protein
MAFIIVMRSDGIREAVEDEIRKRYWDRYAARLSSFPDMLVAEVSPSCNVACAAGIYFGCQRLFSECYFDLPVEHVLSRRLGRAVGRNRVVEVCNLAATKSGYSVSFIRHLIEFIEMTDAEWVIFTATRALRAMLQRNGLNMIELARAEQSRVKNPDEWGSYYKHDPRVMAVGEGMAFEHKRAVSASASLGHVARA